MEQPATLPLRFPSSPVDLSPSALEWKGHNLSHLDESQSSRPDQLPVLCVSCSRFQSPKSRKDQSNKGERWTGKRARETACPPWWQDPRLCLELSPSLFSLPARSLSRRRVRPRPRQRGKPVSDWSVPDQLEGRHSCQPWLCLGGGKRGRGESDPGPAYVHRNGSPLQAG